ncbi:MAG: hypothetical protein COZ67_02550 [Chloroflexi bacterium CG_4_8_14_3_um_filter_45_15]|nr:MAG: hypothetical protein COZ67_02550 [Chloroflexi bacterium CG_4_8_14_3_um_filter_45_15]
MLEFQPKIVVLGIGNLLLRDEGIGVQIVKMPSVIFCSCLIHQAELPNKLGNYYPNLAIIDGGTSPEIMSLVEGADKLIIIDAVKGGKEPGTIYRFTIDDVDLGSPCSAGDCGAHKDTGIQAYQKLSLHQIDIVDNLRMLSLIGKQPKNIVIIGIEPRTIEPGLELSPEIQSKIPEITRLVRDEIRNTKP